MSQRTVDAVVIGAGPNGLAAAVALARAGAEVEVFEQADAVGGGCRTEVWGDGYRSDWGAAVHPMALASPFFQDLELSRRLAFRTPEVSFAHPLVTGAALAWRDLARTVDGLGRDGRAWARLVEPLMRNLPDVVAGALGPPVALATQPKAAVLLARATLRAYAQASMRTPEGRALLAGVVGHSVSPQPGLGASAAASVLAALAHTVGWPIPVGGSSAITDLLVADLHRWGGVIHTGVSVTSLRQLPAARVYLFDTSAEGMLEIARDRVDARYARALRHMRPGNAVSKVDFVLSEPIPWSDPGVAKAGTVHVCGDDAAVREAEAHVARGRHAPNPMIVLSQPSTFDETRAPGGRQVVWAYAHVPAGSDVPQEDVVLSVLERFAPGVRDVVVASRSRTAADLAAANPAMPGGDFASGAVTARQILARPIVSPRPWRAGRGIYLCSGASVPGPGAHGMAGYGAASAALRELFA